MFYNDLASTWKQLHQSNRFLKIVCGALLALLFLILVGWLKKDQVVVLVPPNLDERTVINRNKASQGYKKAWAYFLAGQLGNVTPENADFVLQTVSNMATGEIRTAMVEQIAQETEMLKQEKVSSVYEIRQVAYEPESDKVFVTGRLGMAGAAGKTPPSEQTFEFKIDVRQYSPLITQLDVYPGGPKTVQILQQEDLKRQQLQQQQNQSTPPQPATQQ